VKHPGRDEVWLVSLDDPTQGSEIQETRPCVVVSPNDVNESVRTVIIAPMTSTTRPYPTRWISNFEAAGSSCARSDQGS
jgi:mRNA interferase MazF